eukprot:Hpha_TRINITY_DN10802_c0_g1::TRINITY_DN10802_c0_g1_i1::g.23268::m.23268
MWAGTPPVPTFPTCTISLSVWRPVGRGGGSDGGDHFLLGGSTAPQTVMIRAAVMAAAEVLPGALFLTRRSCKPGVVPSNRVPRRRWASSESSRGVRAPTSTLTPPFSVDSFAGSTADMAIQRTGTICTFASRNTQSRRLSHVNTHPALRVNSSEPPSAPSGQRNTLMHGKARAVIAHSRNCCTACISGSPRCLPLAKVGDICFWENLMQRGSIHIGSGSSASSLFSFPTASALNTAPPPPCPPRAVKRILADEQTSRSDLVRLRADARGVPITGVAAAAAGVTAPAEATAAPSTGWPGAATAAFAIGVAEINWAAGQPATMSGGATGATGATLAATTVAGTAGRVIAEAGTTVAVTVAMAACSVTGAAVAVMAVAWSTGEVGGEATGWALAVLGATATAAGPLGDTTEPFWTR